MSLTSMRKKFKKMEKPIQWFLVIIFAVTSVAFFSGIQRDDSAQAEDLIIAKVNGEEVPRDAFQRALQFQEQRVKMGDPNRVVSPEEEIMMRAGAFEIAVNDTLRAQVARDRGVNVSDRDVQAAQDKMVDQALAGKLEGVPADQQRQYRQQQRLAFPIELVRNHLLGQKLEEMIAAETKPTEADLMKSFQEYKTRHILIKSDTRPDDEAKRRAGDLLAKIKAGESFEKLARQHSEDDTNKAKGGDLGWVGQKTQFVPEFKAALANLKKGEVSPLVKTSYGYHIIKADDVRSALPKDINKPGKKAEYLKEYTTQLADEKRSDAISKARLAAKIEPVDPFVTGYLRESDMLEARNKKNRTLENQKMAEAIAAYEKAAVSRYGGPAIYTKLAELYQQSNQEDKAIEALQKAVSARSNAMMAWQLGELLLKKKRNAEAIVAYEKAAAAAYDMPWLRPQLADRFKTLKRFDLASKQSAEWAKWQKNNSQKPGGQIVNLGNQKVEMKHEQTELSPEETKKFLGKNGAATAVKTEKPDAK